jgi:hypothetical protein
MKRIAVITGASSGIGREFAMQIAENYPSLDEIWLIARREETLRELARSLKGNFRILPMDLSKEEALEELKNVLLQEQPLIRILVNSAGLGYAGSVADMDVAMVCSMIDVNCKALTAVTMLCIPYMRKKSRIIQMDSGAAFLPQPGFAVYAATKSYVLSFDRALGMELRKRKIRVTSVCPGPVDTPFFETGHIRIPAWKRPFLVKPDRVVRKALLDAQRGRHISVFLKCKGISRR